MNNLFQSLEVTHRLDTIIFSFRNVRFKNKPGNFLWYELVPSWSAHLYMHLFATGSPFLFKLRQLPNVIAPCATPKHLSAAGVAPAPWLHWGGCKKYLTLSLASGTHQSSCPQLMGAANKRRYRVPAESCGLRLTPSAPSPKGAGPGKAKLLKGE